MKYYVAKSTLPRTPFGPQGLVGLHNYAEDFSGRPPGLRVVSERALSSTAEYTEITFKAPLDNSRVASPNRAFNQEQQKTLFALAENSQAFEAIHSIRNLLNDSTYALIGKHQLCEILKAFHIDALQMGGLAGDGTIYVTNPDMIRSVNSPFFDPQEDGVKQRHPIRETFLPKTETALNDQFKLLPENLAEGGSKCVYAFKGESGDGYIKQGHDTESTCEEFLALRTLRAMKYRVPSSKLIHWQRPFSPSLPALVVSKCYGTAWKDVSQSDLFTTFRHYREMEYLRFPANLIGYTVEFHYANVLIYCGTAELIDLGGALRRDGYGKHKRFRPSLWSFEIPKEIPSTTIPQTRYLSLKERVIQAEEIERKIPDIRAAIETALPEIQDKCDSRNFSSSTIEQEILPPLLGTIRLEAQNARKRYDRYAETRQRFAPRPLLVQVPSAVPRAEFM